jgi:hypothetical protein
MHASKPETHLDDDAAACAAPHHHRALLHEEGHGWLEKLVLELNDRGVSQSGTALGMYLAALACHKQPSRRGESKAGPGHWTHPKCALG